MKTIQFYKKEPGKDPTIIRTRNRGADIIKQVGGGFYHLQVELPTGKRIVLLYNQLAIQKKLEYNFTICPIKDPKSWIDISGTVIVADAGGGDLELTDKEIEDLFRVPYE